MGSPAVSSPAMSFSCYSPPPLFVLPSAAFLYLGIGWETSCRDDSSEDPCRAVSFCRGPVIQFAGIAASQPGVYGI